VTMDCELTIHGLQGIPSIREGDDLGKIIVDAANRQSLPLTNGDVLVVAQKVISKSEGSTVDLRKVTPSTFAKKIARRARKEPSHVEVILNQTKEIIRMQDHHLITETHHGFVCANAGVDRSNVEGESSVSLLPKDPDLSAKRLRKRIRELTGVDVAVIVSDTFGRPWRVGQINLAIGVSGMKPLIDYRGRNDLYGRSLKLTVVAIADELASAGELIMRKSDGIPVAVISGYRYPRGVGSAKEIVRPRELDLFR